MNYIVLGIIMNEKISKYTGQQTIIDKVFSSNNVSDVYIIEAANGLGKTTLCDYIANKWHKDTKNIYFKLKASMSTCYEVLSPFFDALFEYDNYNSQILKNILTSGSEDIPFVGNTVSSVLSAIFNSKKITLKDYAHLNYFTEREQYILKVIDTFIEGNHALFICEDVEQWDEASIKLLNLLINRKVNKLSFDQATYIITTNKLPKAIKVNDLKVDYLFPIEKKHINDVIHELDNTILCDSVTENLIYTITGGNLQLLISCCQIIDFIKDNNCGYSFFEIIKHRIKNSSINHNEIIKLLQLSSVIGIKFQKALLEHFINFEKYDFENILHEIFELEILDEEANNIYFIQKLVYECFYNSLGNTKYQYHLKLEESLKDIVPTMYEVRAYNLFSGRDYDNAVKLYIIYLLGYLRDCGLEMIVESSLYTQLKQHKYFGFYRNMCSAYMHYFDGNFDEANSLLMTLEENVNEFAFEIDYLYALICTNKYYSFSEFEYGIDRLKKWDYEEFQSNNTEMWLRASILLLDYEYEMGIQPSGKNRLINIQRILMKKSSTDVVMKNKKYSLFLKANLYSKVELAYYQTKKALEYFSAKNSADLYKYYISLLNHSSNELIFGEYSAAYIHTVQAIKLIRNFPDINFLKKEILTNNHTLSGYFNDTYSVKDCIEMLERYENKFDDFADELLINNNLVAFLILNNEYDRALSLSCELYDQVNSMDDTDEYYEYFISNNYMILQYLLGNTELSYDILDKLQNLIPLETDKYYFSSRNNYIKKFLIDSETIDTSASDWNNILIEEHPKTIGKAWDFWGKLLLFSELQTWSDC